MIHLSSSDNISSIHIDYDEKHVIVYQLWRRRRLTVTIPTF